MLFSTTGLKNHEVKLTKKGIIMVVNEQTAVEIAKKWVWQDEKRNYPLMGAIYVPEAKAGDLEGYFSDRPAYWLVSFKCDVPEGFHPDHFDLRINPETGDVEAIPMM